MNKPTTKSFKILFKDDAVWGEQEVIRFRWILVALILCFIAYIFFIGEYNRALISLALASFYIFYNAFLNVLLKKYSSAKWIRYLSATIDISILSLHIYNYSFFFQPIAVATAASTFLYPVLILLSVLRYDGKLVIYSTIYSILCYNLIYFLRRPDISPELIEQIASVDWAGQIYKSAYFMVMGYFLFSIPKMINRLASKQSMVISQRKTIELNLALEKQKKDLLLKQLKKEKKLNRQLEEQKQLIEEQKNQLQIADNTKSKLFRIIGHDLRSPFAAQTSITELILSDYDAYSSTDIKSILKSMQHSAYQGLDLLSNLLDWSKHQDAFASTNFTALKLANIVNETIILMQQNINYKKITLTNNVSMDLIVSADANMVRTILRNLLSNAIKYTNEKGSISIATFVKKNCDYLTITDSGVGMTNQQVSNLFENSKIESTPGTQNEPGTGLGLLLCKELTERNNATIEVESTPGKGSSFSIIFQSLVAIEKEKEEYK